MADQKNTFYVTTPIYYVTARPHLGTVYSTIIADVAARWNMILGKEVFFLTGTDEHGQKVAQAAEKAGKQPKEFVDSFIDAYKKAWQNYEIAYTYFIRTTDSYHVKAVQDWIRKLKEQGDIYKSFYHGWYCTSCETFVAEKDAVESMPPCPSCGRDTTIVSEEAYFFRLSAYQDALLAFYEQHPDFIVPKERAHEVINFVRGGLKDLSISRTTISWGIPFPDEPGHVTYVWADALNNYITAVGYGQSGKEELFKKWWPAELQVMGKDIIRFHAVYWPAFLMASKLPLPKQLLVHGWIKVNQQKMSKSFGNAIDPEILYKEYGPDPVRYYLIRYMAINQDGDFSIADLEQKIASDLADDLGNLLNRMIVLAHKYESFDITAPAVWSESSMALREASWNTIEAYTLHMHEYMFHIALGKLWHFINQVNAYFHEHEPWKVAASNKEKFNEIISATAHALQTIALLLWPIMPAKMEELLHSLGVQKKMTLAALQNDIWRDRFMLKKIPALFVKPEPKKDEPMMQTTATPAMPEIVIDDVAKVQLIVGTIEQAEEVPGSDKLLKLQVNFGPYGMRQILSGVKKSYQPADLQGKQGVFILNLKPRKMMGLESHGMMLFAVYDTAHCFITVPADVPNGTRVQ